MEKKTYLMQDERRGFCKIGRSKNPPIREKTLQAEIPSLKLIHTIEKDIEHQLHNKFKEKRMRGEWFDLNEDDIRYIKGINIHRNPSYVNKCSGLGWFNRDEEFYTVIVDFFEAHLKSNNQKTIDINPSEHVISRRQYFYLKDISVGKDAPGISQNKLYQLADFLNLKLMVENRTFYNLIA